jgi:murein DD-endopeptidase MepM/ murein hydrolase activator NlpD
VIGSKVKGCLGAHLCKIATEPGANVTNGDILGYEESTSFSTGPHFHFEVRANGLPNDPLDYVR